MCKENYIRISEIFGPTIQGEGILIGEPTIFVRSAGCDFRCAWCDTLYAVDSSKRNEWTLMSIEDIWKKIIFLSKNKALTISLSGGNPAIQPLDRLIAKGQKNGYRFAMETQGSLFKPWFNKLDTLVVSPKPPSSQMINDWDCVEQCLQSSAKTIILKIPILDEVDYQFAKETAKRFPKTALYLQPVNHTPAPLQGEIDIDMHGIYDRFRWLIERSIKDQWYDIRILPQLHVLVWGNLKGV